MKLEYRENDEEDVSPEEFLKYVLNHLRTKPLDEINIHWRPQHVSCPFCLLNFREDCHKNFFYSNSDENVY